MGRRTHVGLVLEVLGNIGTLREEIRELPRGLIKPARILLRYGRQHHLPLLR